MASIQGEFIISRPSGEQAVSLRLCPECGARMVPESGCFYCRSCGFSPCKV